MSVTSPGVEARHGRHAMAALDDEPLAREHAQRLAHGVAGDAECAGELRLPERGARNERVVEDQRSDRVGGLLRGARAAKQQIGAVEDVRDGLRCAVHAATIRPSRSSGDQLTGVHRTFTAPYRVGIPVRRGRSVPCRAVGPRRTAARPRNRSRSPPEPPNARPGRVGEERRVGRRRTGHRGEDHAPRRTSRSRRPRPRSGPRRLRLRRDEHVLRRRRDGRRDDLGRRRRRLDGGGEHGGGVDRGRRRAEARRQPPDGDRRERPQGHRRWSEHARQGRRRAADGRLRAAPDVRPQLPARAGRARRIGGAGRPHRLHRQAPAGRRVPQRQEPRGRRCHLLAEAADHEEARARRRHGRDDGGPGEPEEDRRPHRADRPPPAGRHDPLRARVVHGLHRPRRLHEHRQVRRPGPDRHRPVQARLVPAGQAVGALAVRELLEDRQAVPGPGHHHRHRRRQRPDQRADRGPDRRPRRRAVRRRRA